MPAHFKALLSILIAAVCLATFFYDYFNGGGPAQWIALALAPLTVISIWIFPEANAKSIKKNTKKP